MPLPLQPRHHARDIAFRAAALRALAHATRSIDDPRGIYSVLGSLTYALGRQAPGPLEEPVNVVIEQGQSGLGVAAAKRGESLANLQAFAHLTQPSNQTGAGLDRP